MLSPASSSPRADPWEWAQATLLAANLAWTTLCLGGYLPQTFVITATLTLVLLVVHVIARSWTVEARPTHPAGWLLLPFLLCATINVLWITPVRWLGWQDWLGWAQMIAVFWVGVNGIRSRGPCTLLFATLLSLGGASVFLACYQRFAQADWLMLGRVRSGQFLGRGSGSFGIPNSLAGFLLLLIPPCLALTLRRHASSVQRVLFGWLAAVLGFGLVLTISRGGWIAFLLAMTLWPVFSRRWSLRRRVGVAVLALLFVGGGGWALFKNSPKVRERFVSLMRDAGEKTRPFMWHAAWMIFREQPWLGGGAGSYNVRFEKYRPAGEKGEPQWAHNDYLNTLSDYGVTGFGLFFGAVGVIAWRTRRRGSSTMGDRRERRLRGDWLEDAGVQTGFGIGLLAFALQLVVDFHLKIPALALASATLASVVVGRAWPLGHTPTQAVVRESARRRKIGALAAATLVIAAGGGWILPRVRAEALRYAAREKIDQLVLRAVSGPEKQTALARAQADLTRALALDASNAQAWADRAYVAVVRAPDERARELLLGRDAEADARRALALSKLPVEFWLRLGVALDMQQRWLEAGDAFAEALRLAPHFPPAWFNQAYHLGINPVTIPLARSAVATCLRLDPGNPEANALARRLSAGR